MKKTTHLQKLRQLLLILLLTASSFTGLQLFAQQGNIVTGTITDSKTDEPLIGVTILVEGTTTGTISDVNGKYSINVPDANAILVFSSVGYVTDKITVGNNTTLSIKMAPDIKALEEVVVVGYNTTVRKTLTSSVGTADVASMQKKSMPNVGQQLQGTVAGVNVVAANGNPGSDVYINIRGLSSYSGDNNPLVIVDGVQVEGGLTNINSNDIKSIQVLKDASSAAIYGSRGANGVILVTTKKGEAGSKAILSYQNYFGMQQPYKGVSLCNSEQYVTVLQRMYGSDLSGGQDIPQAAIDYLADPGSFKDYSWQNEIYTSAPMQNHDLSVSGGGKAGTYRISAGYVNQDGITLETGYKRANIRGNSDFKVNDRVKIGQSFAYAYSKKLNEPWAFSRSVWQNAIKMYPYFAPKLPNGQWQTSSFYYGGGNNPEALIRNPFHYSSIVDWYDTEAELSMNMNAEIKIFEGLTYKINGSYAYLNTHSKFIFGDKGEFQDEYFDANNSLDENDWKNYNWNIDNLLRYQKVFGKHSVDLTAGFISQFFGYTSLNARKEYYLSSTTTTLNGPGGKNTQAGGEIQESSLLSYIGQAFYSYDDRYMLTFSFRRDGSSRFAPDYRWGNFPGASVGWRLSNEGFWKNSNLANVIPEFKLRAGWGILGRQNLGNYDWIPVLIYNPAVFGSSIQDGLINGTPINEAISWEQLITRTIGLDYSLFKGKVSGSLDFYMNESKDMIIGVALPPSVGGGTIKSNLGNIDNKGFEISLNYKDKIGAFTYDVGFNLGTTKTTLNNFGRDIATGETPEWDVEHVTELHKGGGLSEYWVIKTDGIFKSQEEIDNHTSSDGTVIQPNAKPGDIRFIDFNDDGEISSDGDRQNCGSGVPKVNLGFNISAQYKNFDMYIGATGAYGQVVYNVTKYLTEQNYNYGNFSTALLNAFDPVTNPNSNFPRLNPYDPSENYNSRPASDRYVEDADYLKIRNVEIGYSLPAGTLQRIKLSSLRFFVRTQNLATFTKYQGPDPEIGGSPIVDEWNPPSLFTAGLDRDTAPQARSFQFGLNVTF